MQHVGSVSAAPRLQSTSSIVVMRGIICSMNCGICPDQGSNLCLLHWQVDSLPLCYQGSPKCALFKGYNSFLFNVRQSPPYSSSGGPAALGGGLGLPGAALGRRPVGKLDRAVGGGGRGLWASPLPFLPGQWLPAEGDKGLDWVPVESQPSRRMPRPQPPGPLIPVTLHLHGRALS